tara:strand:- start:2892 stop:3074 length:183 start_codon:yes stop_codon:yes gene_type:complete
VNDSIIKNKLLVIDTTNIDEDGLRELEFALANHCIDYKERDLDVIQELEIEVCLCIEGKE